MDGGLGEGAVTGYGLELRIQNSEFGIQNIEVRRNKIIQEVF